jgi:hypothetical protein
MQVHEQEGLIKMLAAMSVTADLERSRVFHVAMPGFSLNPSSCIRELSDAYVEELGLGGALRLSVETDEGHGENGGKKIEELESGATTSAEGGENEDEDQELEIIRSKEFVSYNSFRDVSLSEI